MRMSYKISLSDFYCSMARAITYASCFLQRVDASSKLMVCCTIREQIKQTTRQLPVQAVTTLDYGGDEDYPVPAYTVGIAYR